MKNIAFLTLLLASAAAGCASPRNDYMPKAEEITDGGAIDAVLLDTVLLDEVRTGGDTAPPATDLETAPPAVVTCVVGSECASSFCSEGFCCNAACTGSCVSCALPGLQGTCSAQAAGTICGASSCASGSETPASACDAVGECIASTPRSCGPYACGANACMKNCTTDAQCTDTTVCKNGTCVGVKPTVVSVSPAQGYVAADSVFVLTFSKKMDPQATAAAVSFLPPLPVDATWDNSGTVLTLKPKGSLAPLPAGQDSNFKVTVGTAAKDARGLGIDSSVAFNFKRCHKFENYPCTVSDMASVTSGYLLRVAMNVMDVGTSGTNVPGRIIQSRAFVSFACGGTDLQQARELVSARVVLKVQTRGAPAPVIVLKGVPTQIEYTSQSYDVAATTGDFTLDANMPATWSLDVSAAVKFPEVRSVLYTFRAETVTNATVSGFDGHSLSAIAEPQLLLDFVGP